MTKKWQQIKKLAYVTTCGPSGYRVQLYSCTGHLCHVLQYLEYLY